MGLLDYFRWPWRLAEAGSPLPPKEDAKQVDSIGYGTEIDPLSAADRKDAATVVSAALRTAQESGRAARYADFAIMDIGDVAAMLDSVVDAVLTFEDVGSGRGFKVEADDGSVQTLLDEAIRRADLQQLAEEIMRDILKFGDGFVEPLFNKGVLTGAQTYRPEQVFVTRDDKGKLATGKDDDGLPTAYQQKRNGQSVAGWQPWEMVHFKLWPSRKLIYSERSLLDAIRADWKKLQLVEQGMVVARVTRAYPRRVHYVDMTGKERPEQEKTLSAYINRMTNRAFGRKQTTPEGLPVADVGEDLYLATGYTTGPDGKPYPRLNKVETEDPAIAGLAEMGDVAYLRQKIWAYVPADVVGIRRNTSGDLDSQDISYTRLLRRSQRQLERGLRQLLDQVLLAAGRLPAQTTYRIVMPAMDVKASWKFSDSKFRASLTLRNYLEVGAISRRFAIKQALNISDREVDAIWKEIGEEANNPIFLPVVINRNGAPSQVPTADDPDGDNKSNPIPNSARVVPATGADPKKNSTTNNGISRGSKLGMTVRGNLSGGAG